MEVEHADSHARRLGSGLGDGARNVVKLEVEEHLAALLAYHADDRRTGVQEELRADLEQADFAHERPHELLRFAEAGDVQCEDQSASRTALPQPAERPTERHDVVAFFTCSETRPPISASAT